MPIASSACIYPDALQFIADGEEIGKVCQELERHQTFYDFRHYIGLIDRKPGALRNGAPFAEMSDLPLRPETPAQTLGGDRIMADAGGHSGAWAEAAGSRGTGARVRRPSGEHVQNVLARLKTGGDTIRIETPIPAWRRAEGWPIA